MSLVEVMTAAEVALLLRVSRWSIYEMVKMRQIPHLKVGRSVGFIGMGKNKPHYGA